MHRVSYITWLMTVRFGKDHRIISIYPQLCGSISKVTISFTADTFTDFSPQLRGFSRFAPFMLPVSFVLQAYLYFVSLANIEYNMCHNEKGDFMLKILAHLFGIRLRRRRNPDAEVLWLRPGML